MHDELESDEAMNPEQVGEVMAEFEDFLDAVEEQAGGASSGSGSRSWRT